MARAEGQSQGTVFREDPRCPLGGVRDIFLLGSSPIHNERAGLARHAQPARLVASNPPTVGDPLLCECKSENVHVRVAWVDAMGTKIQTHGAHVGVILSQKGVGRTGNQRRAAEQIRLLSLAPPPRVVLSIDQQDVNFCIGGGNFLQLLSNRYVEAKAGADKFRMLTK